MYISPAKSAKAVDTRKLLYISIVLLLPFLLASAGILYTHAVFQQKQGLVSKELSIPVSEQNVLITRISFLCRSIQNSHLKILGDLTQNQEDLQSEISTLKDLTSLRLKELHNLRSSVEKNNRPGMVSYLLLQNLETKIKPLDLKHEEFLKEVESIQKSRKKNTLPTELSTEWDTLHKQVLDAEAAFLLHTQKETSELQNLVKVVEKQFQEETYLILTISGLLMALTLVWLDSKILNFIKKNKKSVPKKSSRKIIIILGFTMILFVPIWFLVVAPELTKLPADFSYKALVLSQDNFYDPEKQAFSGETVSNTEHFFHVIGKQNGVLLIENLFKVQKSDGEEIFSVKRFYGIDPKTRKHVPGYGGRDREGYLFAPLNLGRGQNFTYWHINYNAPASLKFQGEETIDGLTVYRYKADYHADQTLELNSLVRSSGDRGINLDINLQLWIEPVTGRKIKYEDKTTAYFYNLTSGERISPWNQFHNQYDETSIRKQVEIAKQEKLKIFLVKNVVTMALALAAIILLLYSFVIRRGK